MSPSESSAEMTTEEKEQYEVIKQFVQQLKDAHETGDPVTVPGVQLAFDPVDVTYMVAPPHPDMRWLSARVVIERLEASARETLQLVVNEMETAAKETDEN